MRVGAYLFAAGLALLALYLAADAHAAGHAPIQGHRGGCVCGARFPTDRELRRHVRRANAAEAEPTVWRAVPVARGPGKRRRGAR